MRKSILFVLICFQLLSSCNKPLFIAGTPTPQLTSTPTAEPTIPFTQEIIHFTTEDGLDLEGVLYLGEENDTGIVFAHMSGPNDQENWMPMAEYLAGKGYSAMTFNFRCYGESDCESSLEPSYIILQRDINAAVDYMKSMGFTKIICVGASMGARACTETAFDRELAGFVVVSGIGSEDPAKQNPNDFTNPAMPKLFIVSESDPAMSGAMVPKLLAFYEQAPEPKSLVTFPGVLHGTEFLESRKADEFTAAIIEFLSSLLP